MKTPTNRTPKSTETSKSDQTEEIAAVDLPRIVRDFCEGQKWAAQLWKDQPHIKPLFDFANNYTTMLTSLSYQPCGTCGGETVVDSGGVTPWGAAIDLPCPECVSPTAPQDPLLYQVTVSNHGDHSDTGGRHSEPQTAPVLDAEGFRRLDKLIDDLKQRIAEYPSDRAEWGMNEWSTLVSLTRTEQLRSKGIPLGPINPSGFSQPDQLK